jgi:hypothetical protein
MGDPRSRQILRADYIKPGRGSFFLFGARGHTMGRGASSERISTMHYLYGSKPGTTQKLVATFDSEAQLLAYVRWATLSQRGGIYKFEQGSPLVGYQNWSSAEQLLTDDDPDGVEHNPTPSML